MKTVLRLLCLCWTLLLLMMLRFFFILNVLSYEIYHQLSYQETSVIDSKLTYWSQVCGQLLLCSNLTYFGGV